MMPSPPGRRSRRFTGKGFTMSATRKKTNAAMVAVEQRGQQAEAGRTCEDEPHDRSLQRATEVERGVHVFRHDFDRRGHLPKRLAAGRKRHEVADVLDDEKGDERAFRQESEL